MDIKHKSSSFFSNHSLTLGMLEYLYTGILEDWDNGFERILSIKKMFLSALIPHHSIIPLFHSSSGSFSNDSGSAGSISLFKLRFFYGSATLQIVHNQVIKRDDVFTDQYLYGSSFYLILLYYV